MAGRKEWEEFASAFSDKEIISSDDYEVIAEIDVYKRQDIGSPDLKVFFIHSIISCVFIRF